MSSETVEELNTKLQDLTRDLAEVEALSAQDPSNEDLNLARNELLECIKLTKEIIAKKQAESLLALSSSPPPSSSSSSSSSSLSSVHGGGATAGASSLQLRAGLYQVGDTVEGRFSGDGAWYEAVVKKVDAVRRMYSIEYVGYGDTEDVSEDNIRPRDPSSPSSTSPSGGSKKRAINPTQYKRSGGASLSSSSDPSSTSTHAPSIVPIPETVRYDPHDPDDVKQQKLKKIKAIKSHNRFAEMEVKTSSKQSSWTNFIKKKGLDKQESIFKSPDSVGGRVGVVNSGKGTTQYHTFDHKKVKTSATDPSSSSSSSL